MSLGRIDVAATAGLAVALAVLAPFCQAQSEATKPKPVGYTDTPQIPESEWRVHDANRPQPTVVDPGTPGNADEPGRPPADAVVLFDGADLSKWKGRDGEARWKVESGYMEVNGTGDIRSSEEFGDCQLHVEWAAPAGSKGESQGKGNSGVFLMGRYEIQVLDSHGNVTYSDGQAAALYGQSPPLVNAARPPGEWQTYDIVFRAPRFADGKLESPGYVTVLHNGVVVHHHKEILGTTSHRSLPVYQPHEPVGPIKLQDHGDPVRYRNIWVRPLKDYDEK